jgi:patatin-like phospholipase/acyl hydrolase
LDHVDLYAGTSTGAVLALGLAAGQPPEALIDVYREQGATVFADSWWDDIRDLGRAIGAAYDDRPLRKVLRGLFGSATLGDLRARVVVPAFDLDHKGKKDVPRMWKAKFFHNFPGRGSDRNELAADVVMRSCAAPTYFPSYQGYVDGGVVANNPSMAALAQVLGSRVAGLRKERQGPAALDRIRLLSLGTGISPSYIRGRRLDWGYSQWAKPLLNLMFDGMLGVADYQCRQLLGRHYHRLSPVLPERIPLDAIHRVEDLLRYANEVRITRTVSWLKRAFV